MFECYTDIVSDYQTTKKDKVFLYLNNQYKTPVSMCVLNSYMYAIKFTSLGKES